MANSPRYHNQMGKAETRECLICGTSFKNYPSWNKRYCSQACKGVARRKPDEEFGGEYRYSYVPVGHPLAKPGSRHIPTHRLTLWNSIGPGSHPCYRCGELVTWMQHRPATTPGSLVADHIDRNKLNNDLSNLRPACHTCNLLNSDRTIADDESYRVIHKGTRVRGETRRCATCDGSFVAWPDTGRPRRGIYCSKACMYAGIKKARTPAGQPSPVEG
jgi:hypothetical protein